MFSSKENNKRERILSAAALVFAEKGYHSAKVEEIAERAGVGKGTIYEYFKSKAELFKQLHLRYMDQYFEALENNLTNTMCVRERITIIVTNHLDFMCHIKEIAGKILIDMTEIPMTAEERMAVYKVMESKIDELEKLIRLGMENGELRPQNSYLTANYIFGLMNGVSHSIIGGDKPFDKEELCSELMELMFNGIASKSIINS